MSTLNNITVIIFGEKHLQMVQSVFSHRASSISSYAVIGSENISDDSISQSLVKLLGGKTSKLKQGMVIGVLPRQSLLLRYMMLPSHQEEELRNMVELQIGKHIPFAREDVITDSRIIVKDSSGYSKVLVLVYPKELIHRYLKICASASVAPKILTIGSLGISEWYAELLKRKIFQDYGTTAIIDMDRNSTEIVISSHHKFVFSRTIKLGAQDLAEGKAQDFLHQVEQTINAFLKEKISDKVEQFALVGNEKNFSLALLQNEFQKIYEVPIHVVGPWDGIPVQKGLIQASTSSQQEPSWVSGIGLAIADPEKLMNFIPAEIKAIKLQKQRRVEFVKLGVLVIIFIAVLAVAFNVGTIKKNRYLAQLDARFKLTKKQVEQIEQKSKRLDLVKNLLVGRRPLVDAFYELQSLIPQDTILTSLSADNSKSLTLQGFTKNNSDVNRLQKSILDAEIFDQANLDYVNKRKTQDGEVNYFKITCKIVSPSSDGAGQP